MVTIRDVAKAAGVSVATVSIVMNDKAKERSIPESTQEKINGVIRELGYQPNLSARKLRAKYKSLPVIVFFWPLDFRISILASFLNAFSGEMQRSDFDCELVVHTYESGSLNDYDKTMLKNGYNGIIVGACTEEDIKHLETIKPQMPVVLVNRESEVFSTVSIDNDIVGKIAAEQFVRKGYKRAAVFASNRGYLASNQRVQAFLKYCAEKGITVNEEHVMRDASSIEGGYCMAENYCRMENKPKAVFCDYDAIAFGAMRALNDKGLKIPDDIEILTIDMTVSGTTSYSTPSLSVIEMPNEEIGKTVIRLLNEKINANSQEATHIKIAPRLILRESFT